MQFIVERLTVAGKINRRDIMAKFSVSAAQAAFDFRRFETEHPGAMQYDLHRKAYIAANVATEVTRDVQAAASRLMRADDKELALIVHHDPGMIRDVAARCVYLR